MHGQEQRGVLPRHPLQKRYYRVNCSKESVGISALRMISEWARGRIRMEDVCGVIHTFLEGAVKMGEGFCAACKAKALAEIVAAFMTIVTIIAHNAGLDSDSLTDH